MTKEQLEEIEKEDIKFMESDGKYYIDDCDDDYDCENCLMLEECCTKAMQISNHNYAESLDFGGYNTEEDFWEQIYG
jgi:hypothetical protein